MCHACRPLMPLPPLPMQNAPDPEMKNIRLSFLLVSAAALGLTGCATQKMPSQPEITVDVDVGIDTAHRALPTKTDNVVQPAHYQHVYIDTRDENAGSLQTISLQDAVNSNVLASSDLQAKPLEKIDPASLKWIVMDKGFPRPDSLEGVGGAGVQLNNFSEVNFATNLTEILDRTKLDELLKLASRVDGMFYVVGYADETGIEASNQTLSQDRAKVVSDAIVAGGVSPSRVRAIGAGISRAYQDLGANRRATIAFLVTK